MTVTSRGLYAYLTILTGNRAGTNFALDARRNTLIGRGTDCHISLPDPLCSRVHATLTCTPDGWVNQGAWRTSRCEGEDAVDPRDAIRKGLVRPSASPWPDLMAGSRAAGRFQPSDDACVRHPGQDGWFGG